MIDPKKILINKWPYEVHPKQVFNSSIFTHPNFTGRLGKVEGSIIHILHLVSLDIWQIEKLSKPQIWIFP